MSETCIWCGHEPLDDMTHETVYACGSVQHPRSDVWSQSAGCVEIMRSRDRIQRAVDTLKKAKRYTVTPGPRNTLDWDPDPDGSVTDSAAVDEALAILEGERDEAT